jgi:hypothetical protein
MARYVWLWLRDVTLLGLWVGWFGEAGIGGSVGGGLAVGFVVNCGPRSGAEGEVACHFEGVVGSGLLAFDGRLRKGTGVSVARLRTDTQDTAAKF